MTKNIRRPLVAGNWKMNGSLALVEQIKQSLQNQTFNELDVVVCPPFLYLSNMAGSQYSLGGQNLSQHNNGAHTGEVSAEMLKEVGCKYVIVGHSERRTDQTESNGLVADKVQQALENGLTPILCVGEPLQIREANQYFEFIASQIDAVISKIGSDNLERIVIAYEPIWAIGTGNTASPEQAQEVHSFIRQHLAKQNADAAKELRILYGGSVNASNATTLFACEDVDGGLIGGASLKANDFIQICQAAN